MPRTAAGIRVTNRQPRYHALTTLIGEQRPIGLPANLVFVSMARTLSSKQGPNEKTLERDVSKLLTIIAHRTGSNELTRLLKHGTSLGCARVDKLFDELQNQRYRKRLQAYTVECIDIAIAGLAAVHQVVAPRPTKYYEYANISVEEFGVRRIRVASLG